MTQRSWPETAAVVVLASRPTGEVTPQNFAVTSRPVAAPAVGQVLVRTIMTSVDPYMLPRLKEGRHGYAEPFGLDEPLPAASIGEVVASRHPDLPTGSWVLAQSGWREYATLELTPGDVVDRQLGGPELWMSVLNLTGVTAWIGLHQYGALQPNDVVVINAVPAGSAWWRCSWRSQSAPALSPLWERR